MKLRLIREDEVVKASEIIARAFSNKTYKIKAQKEIEAMFLNHAVKPKYLVAEEKGEILGLAGFSQSWMDWGIYEIFWVAVDTPYQRQGVGKTLVAEVVRMIKKQKGACLILLTTKHSAFYQKILGFKIFIKKPEKDSYLMQLEIKK
jgi:ribosomal protein S18 acetylase RimI-like enzyme